MRAESTTKRVGGESADRKPADHKPDRRIFMDCAATSFPKPEGVVEAMDEYMAAVRCSLNRGGYAETCASGAVAKETRQWLAELLGYPEANHVVFAPSVTFSLNLVIKGLLHRGDHVLVSSLEHNAVMRPLHQLEREGVEFSLIPCDAEGRMDVDVIESLIRPNTKAVVCMHASNVCGNINPIARIGEICREHGLTFVVDAAQTAGCVPIDMQAQNIDVLCWAGHKSLMGPPGIGGVVMPQEIADQIEPLVAGGTGILSRDHDMPHDLPLKFEAGTYNTVAIYGLHASLEFIRKVRVEKIQQKEMALYSRLQDGVLSIPQAVVHGERDPELTTSVLSVDFPDYDIHNVACYIDNEYNVATRRGVHCSPYAHKAMGTYPDGTIRFSLGYFNTEEDVDIAVRALKEAVEVLEPRREQHTDAEG